MFRQIAKDAGRPDCRSGVATSPVRKRWAARLCALCLAAAGMGPWAAQPACAFNFDDLEKIEKVELKERRVREARAAEARRAEEARQEEARRQAAANAANQGGGGSRGSPNQWVFVEAECITGGACFESNLQVSGGPGEFKSSYGGGLGGQYSYSFVLKYGSSSCVASGSFAASGGKGNIKIGHYPDCKLSSVHEF
jgi:hypothetical protein